MIETITISQLEDRIDRKKCEMISIRANMSLNVQTRKGMETEYYEFADDLEILAGEVDRYGRLLAKLLENEAERNATG